MVTIPKKTGKYVQCEYCGKTVYKTLSQYNKREHHFCSNKCQSLLKRKQTFEYRECEVCKSSFYVSKKSQQRFCSPKCQNEWQRRNVGFKNEKFQGDYIECDNCGKRYLVGKTILENGRHHFCSLECRQTWYSSVWSQSKEWKDKSRKRAVQILNDNPAHTQTKPQIAVNKILDNLFISYRNEEPFVYYSIDNYLPEYKLAIEVMGDYWHSSPLKYPRKLNEKQKHIISRDKAKHTYLKNYHGIEILYLWETDIIKYPDLCTELIKNYIANNGCLENYHSFNYTIDDGMLNLNSDIILPHQETKIAC